MSISPVGDDLRIGWAQADLTPTRPVLVCGQFHARLSEGVHDGLTATALVLDGGRDHAVLVSCDLAVIPDELRDAIRSRLAGRAPGLEAAKVVVNATHTHTGPELRMPKPGAAHASGDLGVDLPAMPVEEYLAFAAERIAEAVAGAWSRRAAGAAAFGLGQAVVGRNRRWVDVDGKTSMYGKTDVPGFSHIEGYEDHSINLLATYDPQGKLTGLVVNVPCPSQVSESEFFISADYWHETRQLLRQRLGAGLFILPQCSAAGDQSPHLLFEKRGAARMLALAGRTARQEIAHRIAAAVEDVLASLADRTDAAAPLRHHAETLQLPMTELTEADARAALQEAANCRRLYEQEKQALDADPRLRDQPRWYRRITELHRRMQWHQGVAERFRRQKDRPTFPAEIHVIRLGDLVFATNPFEYYLDFGIYIKARSTAMQTFLIQLAGGGSYLPSRRSLAGGAYGSVPASNPVGPDAGRQLAERTIEAIQQLWT